MNSRERVNSILNNQLPDRLPFNFWMDRSLMNKLDEQFGKNFRVNHYGADVIESFVHIPWFLELNEKTKRVEDEKTVWTISYPITDPLELVDLSFPDPQNDSIYDYIKNDRLKYPDKAIFALITTPMDLLISLMGTENFFYAIYDEPEIVETFLHKVSAVLEKVVERVCDIDVDVIYLAGDICSTKGSMISNELLIKMCFEPIKNIIDAAHKKGKKVFYHTDGCVMDILDLFVSYDIDGINPLQSNANNDKTIFMNNYGNKLMLYGGIDNCFVIPNGSVSEVKEHIKENFKILGKKGRYIASSHDIPMTVPIENIDAMVEELKNCKY